MDSELVVVETFASRTEADLAKSALEAAGIDSIIQSDTVGGMRPHVAWAGAGFQLLVREEDVPAARELLESPDDDLPA